jgi:hypothetical protein
VVQIKYPYSKSRQLVATATIISMAIFGFFVVMFSSSKASSFISSISGLGAGIAHAETSDGMSDTDAADVSGGCSGPCDGDCDGA